MKELLIKLQLWINLSAIAVGLIGISTAVYFIEDEKSEIQEQALEQPMNENISDEEQINIVNGIDQKTGLIAKGDWELVKLHCTRCHNSKIIINSRFNREGWKELIVWMQETQGLGGLGTNEDKILDYLSEYYAPTEKMERRSSLKIDSTDWYILE